MYSHMQFVLFHTVYCCLSFCLLFDFMTIKSVLLIHHSIFFLSDSDEDPLPPKIRYFDTHACICNKFVHQFLSMYMLLA